MFPLNTLLIKVYFIQRNNKIDEVSHRTLINIALCITQSISKSFIAGEEWKASRFMDQYTLPTRLGNKVLNLLTKGHVIVCADNKNGIYLPAQDLQHMSLWNIYEAIFGEKEGVSKNLNDNNSIKHQSCR